MILNCTRNISMKNGIIFSWMRVFDFTAEVSELLKVAIYFVWEGQDVNLQTGQMNSFLPNTYPDKWPNIWVSYLEMSDLETVLMSESHVKYVQTKTQGTETATLKEFYINCRRSRLVLCSLYSLILNSEDRTEMVLDCYIASLGVKRHLQKGMPEFVSFL